MQLPKCRTACVTTWRMIDFTISLLQQLWLRALPPAQRETHTTCCKHRTGTRLWHCCSCKATLCKISFALCTLSVAFFTLLALGHSAPFLLPPPPLLVVCLSLVACLCLTWLSLCPADCGSGKALVCVRVSPAGYSVPLSLSAYHSASTCHVAHVHLCVFVTKSDFHVVSFAGPRQNSANLTPNGRAAIRTCPPKPPSPLALANQLWNLSKCLKLVIKRGPDSRRFMQTCAKCQLSVARVASLASHSPGLPAKVMRAALQSRQNILA